MTDIPDMADKILTELAHMAERNPQLGQVLHLAQVTVERDHYRALTETNQEHPDNNDPG